MGEWLLLGGGTSSSPSQLARCLVIVSEALSMSWLECLLGLRQGDLIPGSLHVLSPTLLAADRLPDPELLVVR